ncbi:MAG TPA: hypothetical protein VF432_19275 [Thermoanaerobaculia bacterium]
MKNLLVTVALTLIAASASAAIQYEFVQKNTSADPVEPVTDLTARAVIDGDRSRVDFVGGNLYPPGTYVISTDGSRRLQFVDPTKQWYTEVNTTSVATALGASNIRISNLKSSMETRDDRPVIAGYPTEHSRLTITYDISVTMKSIALKQHVRTEVDTWTTSQFPSATVMSFLSGLRTGNPEIDRLLEVESTRVTGFPLRQTVTTRAVADLPPSRSEIKTPTSRTIVREMWVTSIREVPPDSALFSIPPAYRRTDVQEAPKAARETVTFDPPAK